MQQRLENILRLLQADYHRAKNITIHFSIEPWKLNQVDHTLRMISKYKEALKKVILFLDDDQQPKIHRWRHGNISQYIASKIIGLRPTILSKELLMKLDDQNIFGSF